MKRFVVKVAEWVAFVSVIALLVFALFAILLAFSGQWSQAGTFFYNGIFALLVLIASVVTLDLATNDL